MRHDLPTGTVTLVFTDIEGSTRLLDQLGPEAYGDLLARHHGACRAAWQGHGGVEVDTAGDAFFVVFPTAAGALRAVGEAQTALAELGLKVRIGVHTGDVTVVETGYVGVEVHRAARIAAAAHGGQAIVSGAAAAQAGLDGLMELGEHRFKDIAAPVAIFQLGNASFPPLKTISNTNLPRPASSFVGRDRELAEVLTRVEKGARLVTLTGPGGSGKTRLALEAAATLVPEFEAGVYWIGLATLRDPALVTETIAQTLGAKDQLADHIGERELLLVLDNLEQVIDAAEQLSELLRACPNLCLLATSREWLRIDGEVAFAVPPLRASEAVVLFCERAQTEPTDEIHELCTRLDCLPLAVELAAARARVLSPAQTLARLKDSLDVLKGGRDTDPRQQTLRATIDWSYRLLDEEEQRLFRFLSVFAGCTLEAAEDVAGATLDSLQSLVDKSLLRCSNERFWMLETIREYAAQSLERDVSSPAVHERHADFVSRLAEDARAGLRTEARGEWIERLAAEIANVRDALAWLMANDRPDVALRVAGALYRFWLSRGYYEEGRRILEWVIPDDASTSLDVFRAVSALGDIGRHQQDIILAQTCAERMVAIARAREDPLLESQSLASLATVRFNESDFDAAIRLCEESLAIASRIGDQEMISRALGNLAAAFLAIGDYERSIDAAQDAISSSPEPDPIDLLNLANAQADLGQIDAAARSAERALDLAWNYQDYLQVSYGLDLASSISLARGDPSTSIRLSGAADALRETAGSPAEPYEAMRATKTRSAATATLGAALSDQFTQDGHALDLDAAVSVALDVLRTGQAQQPG